MGKEVTLWARQCFDAPNIKETFDDEGVAPPPGGLPSQGNQLCEAHGDAITPRAGTLDVFDHYAVGGTWTLEVVDEVFQRRGFIHMDYVLEVSMDRPMPCDVR